LREYFNTTIIQPFVASYAKARTPVPCMPCNTEVKWGSLLQSSEELGAQFIASGHYARLLKSSDGSYCIGRSLDLEKDQSYMLWGLNQQQLAKTVFPLANFNKTEIRQLAKAFELGNWDKSDSQDICFIPNKTKEFLAEKLGEKPGEIRDIATNKVLGQHLGTHFYTIGQRKGIGLSQAEPIYVVKLDPINNLVYVGERSQLFSKALIAEFATWQFDIKTNNQPFRAKVKIRYNSEAALAQVTPLGESRFIVVFDEEIASISPGQAAVAYDETNSFVIAGAWIEKVITLEEVEQLTAGLQKVSA
jgi:tRNA-uridine 2-sulfurtransferase